MDKIADTGEDVGEGSRGKRHSLRRLMQARVIRSDFQESAHPKTFSGDAILSSRQRSTAEIKGIFMNASFDRNIFRRPMDSSWIGTLLLHGLQFTGASPNDGERQCDEGAKYEEVTGLRIRRSAYTQLDLSFDRATVKLSE